MTRIFKPDSGQDLKLQNNGGTGSVTITDAGDLTIDSPADIILDAEGADITLKDGGTTFAILKQVSGDLVIQPTTSKQIILNEDGGNAALTIDTDGDVNLTQDIYLASGKGIYFDGGTTSANYLGGSDAYEEGNWTPEFRGSGGNDTGASTTVHGATYTRIGNVVTLRCDIRWAAIGSWSGYTRIYGMPYAQSGTTRSIGLCGAVKRIELDTSYAIFASIGDGLSYIELLKQASDQSSGVSVDVDQFNDALNLLAINVTYQV